FLDRPGGSRVKPPLPAAEVPMQQHGFHRIRPLALLAAILLSACGGQVQEPVTQAPPAPTAAAPAPAAGSTLRTPAGWAFPKGSLPTVHATGGMVSTTDRIASEIGVEVLRRGGNAVDAAV